MARAPKRSLGRKKIEIKLIENESRRAVTWSKRRDGIYKKASELYTLCGVQIAIILNSLAGKVYSFGSPTVDVMLDRYMNWHLRGIPNSNNIENYHGSEMNSLNQRLTMVQRQVEHEKDKMASVPKHDGDDYLKSRIENLDQESLKEFKKSMMKMLEEVALHKRSLEDACSSRSGKEVITNSTQYDVTGSPIPDGWLKL